MATKTETFPYTNQTAPLMNCDWMIYPTLEELGKFQLAVDAKGAGRGIFFDPSKRNHGFNTYHRAITHSYHSAVVAMREAGISDRQFRAIRNGMNPGQCEVRSMKTGG